MKYKLKLYIQSLSMYTIVVMQNAALRTATGCTQGANIHLQAKHSQFPYTITEGTAPHNSNRKHSIHHTPYTTSRLQG